MSVRAALDARSRRVHVVYLVDKKRRDRKGQLLEQRAKAEGVPLEYLSPERIDELAGGHTHGGVVARVGPRSYLPIGEILSSTPSPFVAMLDGIEDPYTMGYAARALYAAGVDGILVRPRNWAAATATMVRASAGASEYVPMALAESPLAAAQLCRVRGLAVCTTAKHEDTVCLYEADLTVPLFMLIGGEKRGVQRSFLDHADLVLEIPYARQFGQSLGTVSAAATLAFEVMRQRRARGHP